MIDKKDVLCGRDMDMTNKTGQNGTNKRAIGSAAERKAAAFLQKQGVRILTCNYRCRQGEIDLIAYDGNFLIFAEVKYRSSLRCADPLSAVDRKKQRQICRVADYFRMEKRVPENLPVRYDVIGILENRICWIPNAFSHRR